MQTKLAARERVLCLMCLLLRSVQLVVQFEYRGLAESYKITSHNYVGDY